MKKDITENALHVSLARVCKDVDTSKAIIDRLKNNGLFLKSDTFNIDLLKYIGDEELITILDDRKYVIFLRHSISLLDGDESILLPKDQRNVLYLIIFINGNHYLLTASKTTYERFRAWLYKDLSIVDALDLVNASSFTFLFEDESSVVLFRKSITFVEVFTSLETLNKRYNTVNSRKDI